MMGGICSRAPPKRRRKHEIQTKPTVMETAPAPRVIRFLDVDVDVATETVRRADQEVRLRHKSFQVLLYLLTNRNRLVSRDELFDAVWDGAAVTEDTLVQCVVEIRKALGDEDRKSVCRERV